MAPFLSFPEKTGIKRRKPKKEERKGNELKMPLSLPSQLDPSRRSLLAKKAVSRRRKTIREVPEQSRFTNGSQMPQQDEVEERSMCLKNMILLVNFRKAL